MSGGFRISELRAPSGRRPESFSREFLFSREPVVDVVTVRRAAFEVPSVRAVGDFFVDRHRILELAFRLTATFPFRTHETLREAHDTSKRCTIGNGGTSWEI
jgi:hypothetical protein